MGKSKVIPKRWPELQALLKEKLKNSGRFTMCESFNPNIKISVQNLIIPFITKQSVLPNTTNSIVISISYTGYFRKEILKIFSRILCKNICWSVFLGQLSSEWIIHITTQFVFRELQEMKKLVTHCFFSFISHASSIRSINWHLRKSYEKNKIYLTAVKLSGTLLCIAGLILTNLIRQLISGLGQILSLKGSKFRSS